MGSPALVPQSRPPSRDPAPSPLSSDSPEFEDRGPGVIQRLELWQRQCQQRFGPIRWAADRSQSAWIDHQRRQGIHVVPRPPATPAPCSTGINLVHEPLAADPPTSFYIENPHQFPQAHARVRLANR